MKQKMASAKSHGWQTDALAVFIFSLNVGEAQPADTTASILDDTYNVDSRTKELIISRTNPSRTHNGPHKSELI